MSEMSCFLTNEMSACKAGYGNMFGLIREVSHANILSTTRTGAGNEDAGSDLEGDIRANPLVPGSRDTRAIMQADAQVEKAL